MKKFLSFACCLFAVFFCFSSFVFARLPGDGEKFFLTSKRGGGLRLGVPNACKGALAYGVWGDGGSWFTAYYLGNGQYTLRLGCHDRMWEPLTAISSHLDFFPYLGFEFGNNTDCMVLDANPSNSNIIAWPFNHGNNQKWTFTDNGTGFCRIKNVHTNQFLTYNPSDNRIYGFKLVGPGHPDYDGQLWWTN